MKKMSAWGKGEGRGGGGEVQIRYCSCCLYDKLDCLVYCASISQGSTHYHCTKQSMTKYNMIL